VKAKRGELKIIKGPGVLKPSLENEIKTVGLCRVGNTGRRMVSIHL